MMTASIEPACRCPECGSERTELIRPARLDSADDAGLGVQGSRPGGHPLLFDLRCHCGRIFAHPA